MGRGPIYDRRAFSSVATAARWAAFPGRNDRRVVRSAAARTAPGPPAEISRHGLRSRNFFLENFDTIRFRQRPERLTMRTGDIFNRSLAAALRTTNAHRPIGDKSKRDQPGQIESKDKNRPSQGASRGKAHRASPNKSENGEKKGGDRASDSHVFEIAPSNT